jgi:hypothetical protein
MKTFLMQVGRNLTGQPRITIPLTLLIAFLLFGVPSPAKADSYHWKCPTPQSITIGIDDVAEYLTKDSEGDELALIVTGSADLTEFAVDWFEWQQPLTGKDDKLTQKFLCLQPGDSLALQVRLVELYDSYYVKPLGEFEVTVVHTGDGYQSEWCTWHAQTTLLTDQGQRVKPCYQANAINVFTAGDNAYGMHVSLWFAAPGAANSVAAYPVLRPFAGSVVSPRSTIQPLPTNTPIPATPTPQPTPVVPPFQTLQPANGACLTQGAQFEWQDDLGLPPGQLYEIVVWRAGEDPLKASRGITKADTRTSRWIDLDYLDDQRDWFAPGDYNWGILAISTEPYQRHTVLGVGGWFRYVRGASCGS